MQHSIAPVTGNARGSHKQKIAFFGIQLTIQLFQNDNIMTFQLSLVAKKCWMPAASEQRSIIQNVSQ